MLKPRAVLDLLLHVVPHGHPRRPCRLNFPAQENQESWSRSPQLESRPGSTDPSAGAHAGEGGGQCHPRGSTPDPYLHRLGGEQREMQSKGNCESTGMYCLHFQLGGWCRWGRKMEVGLKSKKAVTGLYFKCLGDRFKT